MLILSGSVCLTSRAMLTTQKQQILLVKKNKQIKTFVILFIQKIFIKQNSC